MVNSQSQIKQEKSLGTLPQNQANIQLKDAGHQGKIILQ